MKILCVYDTEYAELANEFNKLDCEVKLLDNLELDSNSMDNYTDIIFLGFEVDYGYMEKLYMAGKRQIINLDLYKPDHQLLRLNVPKQSTCLNNTAGKWAILAHDNAELTNVVLRLTNKE